MAIIHDKIVPQVPAEAARRVLHAAMTTSFLGVPIEADSGVIGPRWGGRVAV